MVQPLGRKEAVSSLQGRQRRHGFRKARSELTRLSAMQHRKSSLQSTVIVFAALAIVLAGIRAASGIVVPFLISVFVATLTGPLVFWLHRHRVPKILAILFVVGTVVGFITLIVNVAMFTLQDFNQNIPTYQVRLEDQLGTMTGWLQEIIGRFGLEIATSDILRELNLGSLVGFAGSTLLQFGNFLTKSLLVVLTVLFMLLEAFRLPSKLDRALVHTERTWAGFRQFASSVQKYIAIKTATSLATGVAAGTWVWILDVDYPVFWGLVAFLLNYIPNIGSIIAATPAVLMAIVQHGGATGLATALGYLVINLVVGSAIEPQFMGDGVGLSPLVVLMSLVFWGWMLGVAGALLSTPLTITVRIALESYPETRWIGTLIGSGKA
jgi:predicted PurR-regulated permease PerM